MRTLTAPTSSPGRSIRGEYERVGAKAYYEEQGARYRNPHESALGRCLQKAVEIFQPDLAHVLDLAAGSGEATLVLRQLGAGRIDGIDPYTGDAYASRTGATAERLTFAGIAAGALTGRRYSLIVCSFALHLCEPSRLPVLAQRLGQVSGALLVLTPHKKPEIRRDWGWTLVQECVVDRVRARGYRSQH